MELELKIRNDNTVTNKNLYYYGLGKKLMVQRFNVQGSTVDSETVFHQDVLGSNVLLTNSNGDWIEKTLFGSFGDKISEQRSKGAVENPNNYAFTGKERDKESDLDYFGARYLDYNNGRWMKPDLIASRVYNPQTLNKYVYVNNNPVNYIDYLGLEEDYQTGYNPQIGHYRVEKFEFNTFASTGWVNAGLDESDLIPSGFNWSKDSVDSAAFQLYFYRPWGLKVGSKRYKELLKILGFYYKTVLEKLKEEKRLRYSSGGLINLAQLIGFDLFGSCGDWSSYIYGEVSDFIAENNISSWEIEEATIGIHNFDILKLTDVDDWRDSKYSVILDPWFTNSPFFSFNTPLNLYRLGKTW